MFIESGVIIFVGLLLLAIKLPLKVSLRLLNFPLAIDITASIVAYMLHWGTFTGVMSAAVAGLMCSAFTSGARWSFGYIDMRGHYIRGNWDMTRRLNAHKRRTA